LQNEVIATGELKGCRRRQPLTLCRNALCLRRQQLELAAAQPAHAENQTAAPLPPNLSRIPNQPGALCACRARAHGGKMTAGARGGRWGVQ